MPKKDPSVKPYLKWAGGKRQLLPELRKHLPPGWQGLTYYEPFVGAGAMLFELRPENAVINDCNCQLMMTYRMVRDHAGDLIQTLQYYREQNSPEFYYKIRGLDRNPAEFGQLSEIEKAARLIYLNKTCYNGLYRVNLQGLFNVPYGRYKNPAICEEPVLRAVSAYLHENSVTLLNGDFAPAVANADGHSFVYFDPPYHSPGNSNFTGYQAGGFGESEQIRLRDTFRMLSERGAYCLLSNADTEFIRELYRDFTIETVLAKRAINADSTGRGTVNEVVIKSWQVDAS